MVKREFRTRRKRRLAIGARLKPPAGRASACGPKRVGECRTYVTERHYELEDAISSQSVIGK
jgi:hypothetical protein